jgi:hypothetical protein
MPKLASHASETCTKGDSWRKRKRLTHLWNTVGPSVPLAAAPPECLDSPEDVDFLFRDGAPGVPLRSDADNSRSPCALAAQLRAHAPTASRPHGLALKGSSRGELGRS